MADAGQVCRPPDFNSLDPKHNKVAIYNCPACDQNLIQATVLYPVFWDWYPVTYAISVYASDANPNATNYHNGAYQYTKSNQWFAPNFILFADTFPSVLPLPNGTLGGNDYFWSANQLGLAVDVSFYHGPGDWIYAAANSPMRANAGFLDGHVDTLSAEDFCRDDLSAENVARCPAFTPSQNSGWLYISLLPPYGSGRFRD